MYKNLHWFEELIKKQSIYLIVLLNYWIIITFVILTYCSNIKFSNKSNKGALQKFCVIISCETHV